MTDLATISQWCDTLLEPGRFDDASFNGIQVQCQRPIQRIATGVTASAALMTEAHAQGAELVLAHHGIFWEGQSPVLRGSTYARIRPLILNDMALVAYHLPLDAHPEYGNNGVLAHRLGLNQIAPWGAYHGSIIGMSGQLPPTPVETLVRLVSGLVDRPPLHFTGGPPQIQRVAIVSGGAASMATAAARNGFDLFLTGEPNETCMHIAAEEHIHILAAGHHATERFGVRALGDAMAERFGLQVVHLDIPNPV